MQISKKYVLIIVSGCTILLLCTICGVISTLIIANRVKQNNKEIKTENYLGYEEFTIEITNNKEYNQEIYSISQNLITLSEYEHFLHIAVASQDIDSYLNSYQQYNRTAFELIAQFQAVHEYTNTPPTNSFRFINIAYAKERNSWWYYVPVIGSLVKAKHQTIDTARNSIYNYMKNDLDTTDRDRFLENYNLQNIDEIKNADDKTIETLAKDPELRGSIDWTQIATDLGEQSIIATVDGCQIAINQNPLKATVSKGALKLVTTKNSNTDTSSSENRTTISLNSTIRKDIDNIVKDDFGKEWNDIPITTQNKISKKIDKQKAIIQNNSDDITDNIALPVGDWDIYTVTYDTVPIELINIEIKELETAVVEIEYYTLTQYPLDPAIAQHIGFTPYYEDIDPSSCTDYLSLQKNYSSAAQSCQKTFNHCQEYPTRYTDDYYTCIGTDGGCWDIRRWESIHEGNCPIDKDNNLDYSDRRLQDDYEYFGSANRTYCECIVKCRKQHTKYKDCNSDLMKCCQNIENQ